jgi:hypothetical protein
MRQAVARYERARGRFGKPGLRFKVGIIPNLAPGGVF